MRPIWWDYEGVEYLDLFPRSQTISLDAYCQQLMKTEKKIRVKGPELTNGIGIVCHQDNGRRNTLFLTCGKLLEFSREVMLHSPYSPDFAWSGYYLFRSFRNLLSSKTLANDLKSHLVLFFADNDHKFCVHGIIK